MEILVCSHYFAQFFFLDSRNLFLFFIFVNKLDSMPGMDWKNLPEREEDINFDDIYEKHKIDAATFDPLHP